MSLYTVKCVTGSVVLTVAVLYSFSFGLIPGLINTAAAGYLLFGRITH